MGKHLRRVGIGFLIGSVICLLIRDYQIGRLVDAQKSSIDGWRELSSKSVPLIIEQDRLIRLQRMRIEDLETRLELSDKMLIWLKGDLGEEM